MSPAHAMRSHGSRQSEGRLMRLDRGLSLA